MQSTQSSLRTSLRTSLRILVVGAGPDGTAVLRQLEKNPNLEVLTLDALEQPYAVQQGVVERIDFVESLTPLNFDYVIAQSHPDLILWTLTSEDLALGQPQGIDVLAKALGEEIAAISEVPVIEVARGSS